jgi:hypothetical protein
LLIFTGLLRHTKSAQSADDFVPLLIYVVLRANPEHLVSNVQYIIRFRNPDKLGGEAGYYLSSLSGAIQFIENLDRNSLTCTEEEFEQSVEAAVKKIAEKRDPVSPVLTAEDSKAGGDASADVPTRRSTELEGRRSSGFRDENAQASNGGPEEERAAVAGLLRTIQKPLSTIGRIFSEDVSSSSHQQQSSTLTADTGPAVTPLPGNTPRGTPSPRSEAALNRRPSAEVPKHNQPTESSMTAEESAARQASAELAEAAKIQRQEHENVVGYV